MKKLLTLTLALVLTLSLTACGGGSTPASAPSSTTPSTAPSSSAASVASTAPAPESTAPAEDYPYTVQVQIKSPTTADIVLGGVTVKNDILNTRWGVTLDNKYAVSLDVYEAGKYQCSTTKIVVDGKYTNYELINPEIPYTIGEGTLTINVDFTGAEGFDFNGIATYTTEISEDGKGWRPTDFAAADVVGAAPPAESKLATDTPAASTPVAPAVWYSNLVGSYEGHTETTAATYKMSIGADGKVSINFTEPNTPHYGAEAYTGTMGGSESNKLYLTSPNGSKLELELLVNGGALTNLVLGTAGTSGTYYERTTASQTNKGSAAAAPAQDAASAKSSYAGTYTLGKDGESIVITQSGDMLVVEITVNNIGDNQTVKSGNYTTSFAISDIKVDSNHVGIVKTTTTDGLSCAIYFNGAEGPTAGVEIILEGVYSLARSRG